MYGDSLIRCSTLVTQPASLSATLGQPAVSILHGGAPVLSAQVLSELELCSAPSVPQPVFTITGKAPTRAFSWLKAPTSSAFTFKTTQRNYHKGRAAIRHYANQPARPL